MLASHKTYTCNVGFRVHVRFHVDYVHIGVGDDVRVLAG